MYWKDLFDICPKPSSENPTLPAGTVDIICDSDKNYEIQVLPPPSPICVERTLNKPGVSRDWAHDRISDFCSYLVSKNVEINSAQGKYNPIGYLSPDSDTTLWISVSWDPICHYNTSYIVEEDECNAMLGTALDGCDGDTLTNKLGGQVRADCSIWNLTTVAGKNGMPPNGFPRRSVLLT
jgi:hypothetical protein